MPELAPVTKARWPDKSRSLTLKLFMFVLLGLGGFGRRRERAVGGPAVERTAKIEAGVDAGQCRRVIVLMPGRGGKDGYMGRHRDPENRPESIL
jgi:hypothetical protein